MKIVQFQDCISPHQVPLAREIAALIGEENYRYIYVDKKQQERVDLGWQMEREESYYLHFLSHIKEAERAINECDVLLMGFRNLELAESALKLGKRVFLQSERWLKPVSTPLGFCVPGRFKLLNSSFRNMVSRFRWYAQNGDNMHFLAIGPWARKDFLSLGMPSDKIHPWGYFVEPSVLGSVAIKEPISVIFVGRLIKLKHVDTIVRAVAKADMPLTILGDGPEKQSLAILAAKCGAQVAFHPIVPIDKVRDVMRTSSVLVFASDARDGWGAVVSEALEEGLIVFGTEETGASATMLPKEHLFHTGDTTRLATLLAAAKAGRLKPTGIGEWSAKEAAKRFVELVGR